MSEDIFPRGGGGSSSAVEKRKRTKQKDVEDEENDLFAVKDDSNKKKKRKINQQQKSGEKKTKLKTERGVAKQEKKKKEKSLIDQITKLTLENTPGMLTLGVICDIHDYELLVNLPHNLTGRVKITHISDGYKNLLQRITEGDTELLENKKGFHTLRDMFRLGQPLRCKVLDEAPVSRKKKHAKLNLTINPKDVNQNVQADSLITGMVLSGCVASKEDHGYVIDVGVRGITAFLKNKHAAQYIQDANCGKALNIGQYLDCMITSSGKMERLSGENRIINVAIEEKKVYRSAIATDSKLPMNSLIPGMLVEGKVEKVTENGLRVRFMKHYGFVDRRYMEESLKEFKAEQQVKAAILYIEPVTKAITLTQLKHLTNPDLVPKKLFGELEIGDVIEEVEVLAVQKNGGVMVKVNDLVKGYAPKSQLHDKNVTDIHQMFPRGSKQKCRVLYFDYADHVVHITLKESVINEVFLKCSDILPGAVIECNVVDVTEKGIDVKVTPTIKGFIPSIHTADVPLRHPEKKIKIGNKLKCRVLTVNVERKKVTLCNKKTLVKSEYPIITDVAQCEVGMVLEGFVALVKENGVLVVFYNEVKGWVSKGNLSTDKVESAANLFYVGQVVRCKVTHCDKEESRLNLTFNINKEKRKKETLKELPSDFKLGKITQCKITKKTEKGFQVNLTEDNITGVLHKDHLSDQTSLNRLLWDYFRPGDVLDEVICIAKYKTNIVVVSNKRSLKEAEKDGTAITEFNQLKPGLITHGTIKSMQSYGLFVNLHDRLTGLVPTKYACDRLIPDLSSVFNEGDSVVAKVTEIDEEKQRFLLSLRMSDCYNSQDDAHNGVEILREYLQYYADIMSRLSEKEDESSKLALVTIGSVMKVTVLSITDNGAVCALDTGIKGLVKLESMIGVDCKVGKKVWAVVLYVDSVENCVELCLNERLVDSVKHLNDSKYSKAKIGQTISSEVQLVTKDFILVALQGHAVGRLAYVPAKKIFNDIFEHRNFCIGQTNTVVVKKITNKGEIIAALQTDHQTSTKTTPVKGENKKSVKIENEPVVVRNHDFKVGDIVDAVVKTIHNNQININIGEVQGRVHCTEIVNQVPEGTDPMKNFKEGQEIKVKIIGMRDIKSYRYLPISHPNISKSLPDCTIKASALAVQGAGESLEKSFAIGDKVQAVLKAYSHKCLWMSITPTVTGKVYVLNISEDVDVLSKPLSHFKIGCIYNATVINKMKDSALELSLIAEGKIKTKKNTTGEIVSMANQQGLVIKLKDKYLGKVSLSDIADEYMENPTSAYKVGQFVNCFVIGLNKQQKNKCVLSLRKSLLESGKVKKTKAAKILSECEVQDRDIRTIEEVEEGEIIRGYVVNCGKHGVFVQIGTDVTGRVQYKKAAKAYVLTPEKVFTVGKLVTVKVLKIDKGTNTLQLSMLEEDTGVPFHVPEKYIRASKRQNTESIDLDAEVSAAKKIKKVEDDEKEDEQVDSGLDSETEKKQEVEPRLTLSSGFTWSDTFTLPTDSHVSADTHLTTTDSHSDTSDSSDEEEEAEEDGESRVKENKSLSWTERLEKTKKEEQILYQKERQLLNPDRPLETASDFDRLVLQSPDSSMVWLRYMAFHLGATEIEKARAVAERALQTISFREEQEKLNIWVAYMNLENMSGSYETLMKVFGRAVKYNEEIKVYTQLAAIYASSEKYELAEQLYNTMVKKFSLNKEVWINFGTYYFKDYKKPELARKIMPRSFKSLKEKKDHVEIISKFAQLEFKYGEPERGKSMFENLLSTYPKRTDLWSVYIDMVTKVDLEATRELYERLISSNMPVKKMKFCFKKYMEFEQRHGTEETVNAVKQKAIEYVEGNF